MATRYWASRTEQATKDYFWTELKEGRLRQGWGYDDSQDLEKVMATPRADQSSQQKEAWRHRRMSGADNGWQEGDVILIPNMPKRGMFALARVTGPYRFETPTQANSWGKPDFGHVREVELLTRNGVANTSPFVRSPLRHTLTTRSRTWRIRGVDDHVEHIIANRDDDGLNDQSTELQRTETVLGAAKEAAISALSSSFKEGLNGALGKAEWERVIHLALKTHFPTALVTHTGGRSEQGADIAVELPNPLGGLPWVIVIQVKDWTGEIGGNALRQLEQAIEAYAEKDDDGMPGKQVIAAVLASTGARPGDAFNAGAADLGRRTGTQVTALHGDDLMELILRGVVLNEGFGAG